MAFCKAPPAKPNNNGAKLTLCLVVGKFSMSTKMSTIFQNMKIYVLFVLFSAVFAMASLKSFGLRRCSFGLPKVLISRTADEACGKRRMGDLLFKRHTRNPYLWTPQVHPMKVFNAYPTPNSQHLFSAGRGTGKRRCYVKNITSYVKNITSYVKNITSYVKFFT